MTGEVIWVVVGHWELRVLGCAEQRTEIGFHGGCVRVLEEDK